MMGLRAAVFLVAASTSLVLAPAASAGVLGLTVSPLLDRTAAAPAAGVAAIDVAADVVTPVAEAHLQVSTTGVSAEITTPQASVKASVERNKRKPAAAATKPRRPDGGGASQRAEAPAARPIAVPEPIRTALSRTPARIGTPGAPSTPSPGVPLPLEPPSGTTAGVSLALEAAAANAAGASVALAGAVLVAFLLLSQVLRGPARTLRPPLLSFDLQRPG